MANNTGNKYGGRKLGTPNKMTSELRSQLKDIVSGEIEKLPARLETLPDKDRIELLIKFLPYILPKADVEQSGGLQSMDFNTTAQKLIFKPIDLDVPIDNNAD